MLRCTQQLVRGTCLQLSAIITILTCDNTLTFGLSDPATTLIRIEEDWVALVDEPDVNISSPQICNIISPTRSLNGPVGQIQINHRGYPSFEEGGLQVQGLVGGETVSAMSSGRTAVLARSSDNLRYTVTLELAEEGYVFGIRNVRSRTWGSFASRGIRTSVHCDDTTLDAYSPDVSIENSVVNLGAHRIKIHYITAIRRTYQDGHTETDETDRISHRYQLNVEDVPLDLYEAHPEDYNTDITEVE